MMSETSIGHLNLKQAISKGPFTPSEGEKEREIVLGCLLSLDEDGAIGINGTHILCVIRS